MKNKKIKKSRKWMLILAAALLCGGSRDVRTAASESMLVEEAGIEEADILTQPQDSTGTEEVWISEDSEPIFEAETGADTSADEKFQEEEILEESGPGDGTGSFPVEESDEGLILEIEEADDPGYVVTEESAEDGASFAEETDMILLEAAGDASCAAYSRVQAFSLEAYEDSYGEQLSGESSGIYQKMTELWAAGSTDNLVYTFSDPYSFDTEGTIQYDEDKEANVVVWDKENSEEYKEVRSEMSYAVQSAFDAFAYDYPEVFWLGKVTYSYSIGFSKISDTTLKGSISSITLCAVGTITDSDGNVTLREKYEGAPGEIGAFQSAVAAAVEQIRGALPEDADTYDTVKEIHDYICNTVSYGENEYAHTAAGVFHKEPKTVVCEGYAKAMKILCGRFGISSALIVGNALKSTGAREDHMWNYIRMEDGSWYLVDATWDDQAGGISYVYFLVGSSSQGFNAVISEERQTYTCFSGAAYTKSFALPALSEAAYHEHTFGEWETVKEATCTETGSRMQTCSDCQKVRTEEIAALGHDYSDTWTTDQEATCTKAGSKSRHCTRKGCSGKTDVTVIPESVHSWDGGKETKAASCTSTGTMTYTCENCGSTKTEETAALGHDYSDTWTTDQEATCTKAGSKSRHCTRNGCSGKADVTLIPALDHRWEGTETKAATCTSTGIMTYTCKECGETKTESIAALGHDYSTSWTTDQEAACTKDGSKSRHCIRKGCSSKTDVTVIKASGHTWNTGKVTKSATCTASGVRTYTCKTCGGTKTKKIAALGHKYGSWVTTKAATVLKAGVQTSTCSRCGGTKKRSVAKLEGKIKLNVTALPLKVKQSTTAVKVTKMSAGDYVKSWKSSNTKIASVSQKGKITGKKTGKATITVTLASGAKASVKVTVQKSRVTTTKLSVTAKGGVLKKNQITLKKGARLTLTAAVSPLTSTDQVVYSSSNKKVAAVSGKGVVLAKGAGTARITVKSGKKKAVITVKVQKTSGSGK